MKVGTFVVKGPYLSVCMCLCMLEYMLMKPGTYAYGAGNTCKCSLIYLAGESVRADLLYWSVSLIVWIGNKMSGKIETGCYFDLSEYLCWQKYRKAFSSLYKKSIGETSCWKEKNYSLNRTTVFVFGFYDMVWILTEVDIGLTFHPLKRSFSNK